ncbi:hypothetical protein [Psychroserpens sp. MEBiC05023]
MKVFLKKTLLFFLFLYGSMGILVAISSYAINKHANFKLSPHITKIVLGNSQPECAFDDTLISQFKNLANSGESYFYSYQKLKQVLKQNPQINTVFIELNPTTILIREDEKIWQDRFIKHQVPNNLSFFNFSDHKILATKNHMGYQQALLKGLKRNLNRIVNNEYNFIDSIGGYRRVKWNHMASILDTLSYDVKTQYSEKQKKTSLYDIEYLKKMIDLCNLKSINIQFVRSPYHSKFIGRKYEVLFQKYREKHFKDIVFLDFKDFILEDSEYGDLQHLNYKGALKFSKWFENQINRKSTKSSSTNKN